MNFTGKRVLVTGGTRGIGRATVEAFVAAGARVAVNGSSEDSTARALAELAIGDRAIAAPGDIGVVADCRRVVETAVEALGGLDVLVNNAGFGKLKSFDETTAEDWDRTINVNLRGTFFCTRYAVPALRESTGNVVNVASIGGLGGNGLGISVYAALKGGVVNLTRDLAIELGPEIRVNCLCPGATDTEMLQEGLGKLFGDGDVAAGIEVLSEDTPLRRVAKPEEMANAILYLASDLASFVTGAIHVSDGGVVGRL